MRVLVIVASRHGSTDEIGDVVAGVLRERGHEVERMPPGEVASLDDADAVVLGSAIYMSQWLEPARDFVARNADELRRLPVWMFSSGPVGPEARPAPATTRIHALLDAVEPLDYQVFSGVVDQSVLSLRERSIVRMVGAAEGDFRDWDAVKAWAAAIADTLAAV
jgi:menaquinone-dependent protoporphyrinogen oxidase